ncbi:recombinase family protein [Lacipirellula parvula]|nr:recombinase family protein [Lacipirellula parvula]
MANSFGPNVDTGNGLRRNHHLSLNPVVSRRGGQQQGQNRDNFLAHRAMGVLLALVLAAVLGGSSPDREDDILPRPIRKHRKAREEQGLPEDSELESLAREYLRLAAAAWPEHLASGYVPHAGSLVVGSMVAEFKERHMTGKVDVEAMNRLATVGLKIAANYPRYSDHNSQPKSIADQVREAIAFAKSRGLFIPWGLIVADFGRRATQGHRQGFENLLKIVRIKALRLEAIIIDDFDRASRNDLEAWKLAGMCKTMKIGLYGASDGFHIDDPDWDFKVRMPATMPSLIHRPQLQRLRF